MSFTYRAIVLFLGVNDLKVSNWQPVEVAHDPAADLRFVLETIASDCPRTLGVVVVDPLPLVPNRSYTRQGAFWDLSLPGRGNLSETYASMVGDVVFEQRNRLHPRLRVEHLASSAFVHDLSDFLPQDGVHYDGTYTNGTRTILHAMLAAALQSAVRRVLADKAVLEHHERERLRARAAARSHGLHAQQH